MLGKLTGPLSFPWKATLPLAWHILSTLPSILLAIIRQSNAPYFHQNFFQTSFPEALTFLILCKIFQLLIEYGVINSKFKKINVTKKNPQHSTKKPNHTTIKPSSFSTLSSANRSLHLVHSDHSPQASETSAWYVIIILRFKNHQ